MERDSRKTISVPEAGKWYFDLGRNASYEAARRGELPTVKIGRRIRVPILALEKMLVETTTKSRNNNMARTPQTSDGEKHLHCSKLESEQVGEGRPDN